MHSNYFQNRPPFDSSFDKLTTSLMVNHHIHNKSYLEDKSNDPEQSENLRDSKIELVEGPIIKYWYVYIAQARTGRFYVGITTNPQERILEHNSGEGSKFAREQGPFKLVYVSPPFPNKSEARKREIQVKGWRREKKLKLIQGIYK